MTSTRTLAPRYSAAVTAVTAVTADNGAATNAGTRRGFLGGMGVLLASALVMAGTSQAQASAASSTPTLHPALFARTGPLALGTGTVRWYNRTGVTLQVAWASVEVGTAPTGAAAVVDIKRNGTSLFARAACRPTVAMGRLTSGKVLPSAMTTTQVKNGQWLTIDVTQVGSLNPGADLSVTIALTPAG